MSTDRGLESAGTRHIGRLLTIGGGGFSTLGNALGAGAGSGEVGREVMVPSDTILDRTANGAFGGDVGRDLVAKVGASAARRDETVLARANVFEPCWRLLGIDDNRLLESLGGYTGVLAVGAGTSCTLLLNLKSGFRVCKMEKSSTAGNFPANSSTAAARAVADGESSAAKGSLVTGAGDGLGLLVTIGCDPAGGRPRLIGVMSGGPSGRLTVGAACIAPTPATASISSGGVGNLSFLRVSDAVRFEYICQILDLVAYGSERSLTSLIGTSLPRILHTWLSTW